MLLSQIAHPRNLCAFSNVKAHLKVNWAMIKSLTVVYFYLTVSSKSLTYFLERHMDT